VIYYFAYGSNMDEAQMREGCPDARLMGVGRLKDYKLAFTRRSSRRECGVADALPAPGENVWGVLWELTFRDLARLDKREGVPGAYERATKDVWLQQINGEAAVTAEVYFVSRKEKKRWAQAAPAELKPNAAYKSLLLNGARQHGLPKEYVGKVITTLDTND